MTLMEAVRSAVTIAREGKHVVITRVRTDCDGDVDRPGIYFEPDWPGIPYDGEEDGFQLEELYGHGNYEEFHGFDIDDALATDWRVIGEHDWQRFRDGSLERETR